MPGWLPASAADAGADAIGVNFYPGSKRYVSRETAAAIREAVAGEVKLVGVFVNATIAEVVALTDDARLDLIQLHGDETAEFVAELRRVRNGIPIVRAFRSGKEDDRSIAQYVAACGSAGAPLDAILIDAYVEGEYGGVGKTIDWECFRELRNTIDDLPLIRAGGLSPDNVEQAIATAQPDAVDVASGVESSPGRKDVSKMQRFIESARRTLESARS